MEFMRGCRWCIGRWSFFFLVVHVLWLVYVDVDVGHVHGNIGGHHSTNTDCVL
jgi:hypothetical protein